MAIPRGTVPFHHFFPPFASSLWFPPPPPPPPPPSPFLPPQSVASVGACQLNTYNASLTTWLCTPCPPNTLHHAGEGALGPAAPSKEEFLQYGVENGGDRATLAVGLSSCRDGSVKDTTYKVCACSQREMIDLMTFAMALTRSHATWHVVMFRSTLIFSLAAFQTQ